MDIAEQSIGEAFDHGHEVGRRECTARDFALATVGRVADALQGAPLGTLRVMGSDLAYVAAHDGRGRNGDGAWFYGRETPWPLYYGRGLLRDVYSLVRYGHR